MNTLNKKRDIKLAEVIRQVCVDQAKEGFRDASMSGLCAEGAMEAAVSAIQMINVEKFIEDFEKNES